MIVRQTRDPTVFRFPCRFPAALSIRPKNRVQDADYEDFPLRGEPRKKIFSLSFPERQGRGGGGAYPAVFRLSSFGAAAASGSINDLLLLTLRLKALGVGA